MRDLYKFMSKEALETLLDEALALLQPLADCARELHSWPGTEDDAFLWKSGARYLDPNPPGISVGNAKRALTFIDGLRALQLGVSAPEAEDPTQSPRPQFMRDDGPGRAARARQPKIIHVEDPAPASGRRPPHIPPHAQDIGGGSWYWSGPESEIKHDD